MGAVGVPKSGNFSRQISIVTSKHERYFCKKLLKMSALEVKNDLLRLLFETDDVGLLEKVRAYFKSLKNEEMLSEEELEAQEAMLAKIGLEQIKNGQVMSHEEARKKINERLRKLKK
jgi:predicted transcriptional regulator